MAGHLEPADYAYFGEHAYPLAQRWLEQQVQEYNQAESSRDVRLPPIDDAYWSMLSEFGGMCQICLG